MLFRRVCRTGLLLLPLLATGACSGSKGSKGSRSSDVVLSKDLRVLDTATLDQLSDVSEDQTALTFDRATDQLSALESGNVIASGVLGTLLPRGMLRKVVSVEGSGPVTVTTEAASITDAIVKGSIDVSVDFSTDRLTGLHTLSLSDSAAGLTYGFDNQVIHDGDGDTSTTNDQVLLSGSISIDPVTHFPIQIDSGFTKVDLDISGSESASLSLTAKEGAHFQERADLDTEVFAPLTIDVAGLPVVLTPVLTFYAGVDGSASAQMTTSVNEQATLDVGVGYQDGSFGPFNHSDASGSFDPPNFVEGASASAKAYAGARLSIYLWVFESAYVDADVYARAEVQPTEDPWWSLYGGAEGHAGVGLLGLDYDHALGNFESRLASAPGGSSASDVTSWSRVYTGDSSDELMTVAPLGNDGWLAGGTTLSFTPTPNDAWLVATDSIGNLMWQRAYEDLDAARVVRPTSDGDFLVAMGGSGVADLMKVDDNGSVLWAKEISDPDEPDLQLNDIVVQSDGSALLGGTAGSFATADFWLAKIDGQANLLWSFRYGGGGEDDLTSLADTGDGGCLAVGTSESFTPLPLTWALRLDADGKILWQKTYGESLGSGGDIYGRQAVHPSSGGFFIGGESVLDALAIRLDDDGGLSWATDIPNGSQDAEVNGVASLPDGGFAMAGSGDSNAWAIRLDSSGSVSWSHEFGGSDDERVGGQLGYHGVGAPLLARSDGSLVAAGTSASFGDSGFDGWLFQLTPNGNVVFASGSGASETDPSGSYAPADLVLTSTSEAAKATVPSLSDLSVTIVSTDAETISQAP